jgi:hypothetical protein
MGYIYEVMDLAKEAIKRRYKDEEAKYMPLWDIIDECWDRQLHSPLHVVGYFLNPTYFYDKTIFNEDGEVGRGLMTCIERCFPDQESQSCIIAQLQDYRVPTKLFAYASAICERKKMLPSTLEGLINSLNFLYFVCFIKFYYLFIILILTLEPLPLARSLVAKLWQ